MEPNFERGFDDDQNLMTDQAFQYLDSAARWARTLAIIGYVMLVILVLAALFLIVAGMSDGGSYGGRFAREVPLALLGFGYLVGAVLYFFPIHYLYNFATAARDSYTRRDAKALETAMRFMHMHYQFIGILTIIFLSLYGLLLLLGILAAAANGFR
jgi:hypothetical protein